MIIYNKSSNQKGKNVCAKEVHKKEGLPKTFKEKANSISTNKDGSVYSAVTEPVMRKMLQGV